MDPTTLLADLEVSVATADFLATLPAKTLVELLALPVLEVPKKRIAQELESFFASEELDFAGTFVVDVVPTLPATGDVLERWATIEAWLAQHHPVERQAFRAPAREEEIAAAEAALGLQLPLDYRSFLLVHDGQEDGGAMVWTCTLHPVGRLAEEHKEQLGLLDEDFELDASEVAEGIRPVQYSPQWIPIGTSARGRDFLSIDLDPADGGTRGQIILTAVDSDAHQLIASSFTELLSVYFEGLQNGDVEVGAQDD